MNTYKLLRNNKEIGPLSLEELIAKGLKPYDLIWVQNRSAAWRYPSEIEELKAYAPITEEQPYDRFFKKASIQTNATPVGINSTSQLQHKKEKPRFRITATSKKIDEKQSLQTQSTPIVQPEHFAYVPTESKVSGSLATFNHYNNSSADLPTLETKYQGSLDDIKKRYEETVLKPKQSNVLYRYAWLLIIPVLAAGIWFGYKLSAGPQPKDLAIVSKPKLENLAIPTDSFIVSEKRSLTETEINKPTETTIAQPSQTQQAKHNTPPSNTYTTTKEKPAAQTKTSAEDDANKQIVPSRDEIILPAPKTTSIVVPETQGRQPRVRTEQNNSSVVEDKPIVTITSAPPAVAKQAATKSKKVNDYVVVDGDYKKLSNSIQDLSLKVENVTPYPIDLVVLDIQYFDKNGKLQKGETVYAKNIAPRRDVVVNAPFSNNAYSVGYKVSLVSAEKAGVYLVAE
jgi:hypothetical protein